MKTEEIKEFYKNSLKICFIKKIIVLIVCENYDEDNGRQVKE